VAGHDVAALPGIPVDQSQDVLVSAGPPRQLRFQPVHRDNFGTTTNVKFENFVAVFDDPERALVGSLKRNAVAVTSDEDELAVV